MQPINDDMDDLYRKAAEDYPLKTDGANWDKLVQQMQQEPPVSKRGSKNSRFLWLLLLLPMVFICNNYISDGSKPVKETAKANTEASDERMEKGNSNPVNGPGINGADRSKIRNLQNNTTAITDPIEPNKLQATKAKSPDKDFKLLSSQDYTIHQNVSNTKWNKRNTTGIVANSERPTQLNSKDITGEKLVDAVPTNKSKDVNEAEIATATTKPDPEKKDSTTENKDVTPKAIDTIQNSVAILSKTKNTEIRKSKTYYGFIGGPDFSTVKMQKLEGVGYNFGVVGGYKFTNSLGIETGFLWNNKKYYSNGEHFDAKNMGWAPHTELIYISGYCNMFEIPFNIRYDWVQKGNDKFFVATGISSYLMNKESYDYLTKRYNVPYKGAKVYHHSTKDWFSIVSLSLGYQKKLGAIGDLRIEPYFKLPVKGIGIGSMSIASTGIYFGLTRTIQ